MLSTMVFAFGSGVIGIALVGMIIHGRTIGIAVWITLIGMMVHLGLSMCITKYFRHLNSPLG